MTVPDRLVGATDWCTHPARLDVARVRGTKNPDRGAIEALNPDLVVVNREENGQLDVERLRAAGIRVWVTVVESIDGALTSLRRLFADVLDIGTPPWLSAAAESWSLPAPLPPARVVVPIWRERWIVVGAHTFTGDVLARLGLVNPWADSDERYPRQEIGQLQGTDLVLLPDEPYLFSTADGPEAFHGTRSVLASGRLLTWYGPSLTTAREDLTAAICPALTSDEETT